MPKIDNSVASVTGGCFGAVHLGTRPVRFCEQGAVGCSVLHMPVLAEASALLLARAAGQASCQMVYCRIMVNGCGLVSTSTGSQSLLYGILGRCLTVLPAPVSSSLPR